MPVIPAKGSRGGDGSGKKGKRLGRPPITGSVHRGGGLSESNRLSRKLAHKETRKLKGAGNRQSHKRKKNRRSAKVRNR